MISALGREGRAPAAMDCLPREEREEAGWLDRARAGDEAAYRWLLDRYRARVVRLAAHILHREGEAEDIAQEAFLRAFRRLPSFRGEGRFSAWLLGIVVRLCLDRRRSAWWTREVPGEALAPPAFPVAAFPADAADTRLLVEMLLDRLSPPMRAALVLREMEGLDYEEIAATLGIPVGTVRSRLHAARAQFRALWTAAGEKEDEGGNHV